VTMNVAKDLAVYRILLIALILFAEGYFGRPHDQGLNKGSKIIKRVEISGTGRQKSSEVASRRQNVIHAGQDYDSDGDNRKPEEDELENLGKVVDYDGKVIETNKPGASKWKDTAAISKDVIERIKEIQESLIKRSGGKKLEEKLELLQPEKNVTVATSESNGVTSRKIIPEDVVNKIIEKFQELRSQAKELAELDHKEKEKEAEKRPIKVEIEGKGEAEKPDENKGEKAENANEKKAQKFFSPYESIGPAKENEEVKNITQHSVTESTTNLPGNQEIFKSSSSGPVDDEQGKQQQQQHFMQEPMQNTNNMFQQQQQQSMTMMQQNKPGNMMMMPGKVPMMFVKSGEMLVPVFGGQNGPSYGYPTNGYEGRRGLDGQSGAAFIPTQQRTMPALVPQQPMIENGQSRSGPQTTNMGSANGLEIPSVPYSVIMSLMSAPGMVPNIPSSQLPMNPGAFSMPQMTAANIMQSSPNAAFGFPHGDMTGFSRSFQPDNEVMAPVLNQQGQLVGPTVPSMANEQPTGFIGGGLPQESQMASPRNSGPLGVSMDLSGRLSLVNSMNSAFLQQQNMRPLAANPFQNLPTSMELVNREKQMLNPSMVNPVNDLSDPMEGPSPPGLKNVSPDQLLELAKVRSNDQENPEGGEVRTMPRDPDSLLDTLHTTQLNRELSGPGDPEKTGMMGENSPINNNNNNNNLYAGTNPETLLDMLSKRKSNNVGNREVMDWEQSQQNKLFNDYKNENEAFGRGQITPIGTNGMQSVSSLPATGALDPSFADLVGNQPFGIESRNSATENPVENSFFQPGKYQYYTKPNSISVMSQDDLRYEHSRHAIDSGEGASPINQADVYVRHKIMSPSKIGEKRSSLLQDDNIELKVNGKPMAETASLRSKIVNGKIERGHGKTLTSKSPVRIELSHSNDAKKTKVINIVTTGKFDVKESRRDKISKKGNKKGNIIKTFYKSSS